MVGRFTRLGSSPRHRKGQRMGKWILGGVAIAAVVAVVWYVYGDDRRG
jgi:hypothetical protein